MVSRPEKIDIKSLFSRTNLYIWVTVFLVALASRLIFLTFSKQLPVFWDARLYASAAIGILGYLDRDEAFARGENDDKDFAEYYTRYLNGEDIHWLYYKVPSLSESQKYLFYSGPLYPTVLAAVFSLDWERDFQAVRWFNAILDSLAIIILSMLVFIIWGRAPALGAALLQLLYIPSILTTGVLTLETITSFLISLFLLLAGIYYRSEKKWAIIGCGILGGLMVLTKPTASLLTLPLFVFLGWVYIRRIGFLFRSAVLYFIPFCILVIPWIIFTSNYYGQLAFRDPDYSRANFRASSSIDYEGYDLDYSDPDFWTYSVTSHILSNPVGYTNLLSKKIIRMWWMPHDEFWQGSKWFETFYHRGLLLITLFGLAALPFMKKPILYLPFLVIGYYAGIHIVFHALPRYNFNALPAVFIVAISFITYIIRHFRQSRALPRAIILFTLVSVGAIIINSFPVNNLLASNVGTVIPMIISVLLLLTGGYFYTGYFVTSEMKSRYRIILWLPFILLCITTMTGWSRPDLEEWYTPVSDTETRLVTEIHLPPGISFAENDVIKLVIDMTSDSSCQNMINVQLNGLLIRFQDGQGAISQTFFSKGVYQAFHQIMKYDLASLRWYRSIAINPDDLNQVVRPDGLLAVAISLGDGPNPGNGLRLYGDSFDRESDSIYLPSFSHRSIERFRELGDRRIYEKYGLNSRAGFSYIYSNGEINNDDLSPRPGKQRGRYRVYLLVKRPDFKIDHY